MSLYRLLWLELQAILSNRAIFLTLIMGTVFYSFLYPQPYLHQIPREQKIAVIDNDNSAMSRKLIRMVQATPQVDVAVTANNVKEARKMLISGCIRGLLLIPENFGRNILLQASPVLVYAGDGSYFLVYGAIAEGITAAAAALDSSIVLHRSMLAGKSVDTSLESSSPIILNASPVFNPSTGYINYVVPAVFVLILHQTLLIGASLHGASEAERKRAGKMTHAQQAPPLHLLLMRLLAFFLIYIPIIMYYFGFCFHYYGLSRLASLGEIIQVVVPFLLATTALGIVIGQFLPRRELATLLILLSSLPLIFSAGFIWPVTSIPFWIHWLVQWAPSTPAIGTTLHLNQMGADFHYASRGILHLWGLFIVYFIGAWWLLRKAQ